MKQIKVILSQEQREFIDAYAKKHNLTFSQALRIIIANKQKEKQGD